MAFIVHENPYAYSALRTWEYERAKEIARLAEEKRQRRLQFERRRRFRNRLRAIRVAKR